MERTLLGDVHPKYHFIAKNGTRIVNLRDLYNSINHMDDITFNHHVNDFKNDFHNWVRDIHKDKELANGLLNSKSKKEMAEKLKARISELESIKEEVKEIEAEKKEVKPAKEAVKKKVAKKPKKEVKAVEKVEYDEEIIEAPINIENPLKPENVLKLTLGDFALGLIIGTVIGIVIAYLI